MIYNSQYLFLPAPAVHLLQRQMTAYALAPATEHIKIYVLGPSLLELRELPHGTEIGYFGSVFDI